MGAEKPAAILAAAAAVFAERGFHRATLDEIVQAAGTGKGTVYHHFGNKEQLFWAVIEHQEQALWEDLAAVAARQEIALAERVLGMVETYMSFVARRHDLWRALSSEPRLEREAPERRRARFRERIDRVAGIVERALSEASSDPFPEGSGSPPAGDTAKDRPGPSLIARSLIGAAHAFAMHWCSVEQVPQVARQLVELHLKGLVASALGGTPHSSER